jgi:hypothetical protein
MKQTKAARDYKVAQRAKESSASFKKHAERKAKKNAVAQVLKDWDDAYEAHSPLTGGFSHKD